MVWLFFDVWESVSKIMRVSQIDYIYLLVNCAFVIEKFESYMKYNNDQAKTADS